MHPKRQNAHGIYLTGIRDGQPRQAMATHTGARYRQHSTGVPDGKEGFIAFFDEFVQRHPQRDIRIVRSWVDGPLVFVQAYQDLDHGQARWATLDFFATDADDRVIEHWDVIVAHTDQTPSGHSSIDGPTEIEDLPQTEANRQRVRDLFAQALIPGAADRLADYVSPTTLVQHSLTQPDGFAAFQALTTGPAARLRYRELVLLAGQGNFVATLAKADYDGQPYAQADIFRLADGRVVERWEAGEPVPAQPVNSGKF